MTEEALIENIIINPEQPRLHFDERDLEELAQSIRLYGIEQPLVVEETATPGVWLLNDGERRLRAAKKAGLKRVPITVTTSDKTPLSRLLIALTANIQRADLTPIEEARAFARLRDEFGMSQRKIAESVGKSDVHVGNRLSLLTLDEPIQSLVASGRLPCDNRIVKALVSIPDIDARLKLAAGAAERGMTIRGIVSASERLRAALTRKDDDIVFEKRTPALVLANNNADPAYDEKQWWALQQIGQVPPWDIVTASAKSICNQCVLRESASSEMCQSCPAPALITEMIQMVGGNNEP